MDLSLSAGVLNLVLEIRGHRSMAAAIAVDGLCNDSKALEAQPRNNGNDFIITCLLLLGDKQHE